jgi:hypothetical protein
MASRSGDAARLVPAGRDDRYRQTMRELVAAIDCSAIVVPAARAGTIRAAGGRHWLFRHRRAGCSGGHDPGSPLPATGQARARPLQTRSRSRAAGERGGMLRLSTKISPCGGEVRRLRVLTKTRDYGTSDHWRLPAAPASTSTTGSAERTCPVAMIPILDRGWTIQIVAGLPRRPAALAAPRRTG